MNLDRKVRMQERTIQSLRDKNKKLESENKALHTENAELSDKVSRYEQIIGSVDSLRNEWNKNIQESLDVRLFIQQVCMSQRMMELCLPSLIMQI